MAAFDDADIDAAGDELDPDDSTSDDIARLHAALQSERACPELLPFQKELVEELSELLTNQQSIVDDVKHNNPGVNESLFSASLYQMEIERVRYALSAYLRTRLHKVVRSFCRRWPW